MTFAIDEPVTAGMPWAVITVTIVPGEDLGATEIVVSDANTAHPPALEGRHVAGVFSVVPVAVNPTRIDHGTITFAVAKSWLGQYGLSPEDIVLLHNNDGAWEECPTTYGYEENGMYYFTATTPGFSYFAIASRPGTAATDTAGTVPAQDDSLQEKSGESSNSEFTASGPASAHPAAEPVAGMTTAAPGVTTGPAISSGIPVLKFAAVLTGLVLIAAGGLLARRRWIRRQNPALFEDYD